MFQARFFYSGVPHRPTPRSRSKYTTKSVLMNNLVDIGSILYEKLYDVHRLNMKSKQL